MRDKIMIKNKIKKLLKDVDNLDMVINDDVNIDIARANYQKYQDDLKQRQKEYIKTLCNEIRKCSRQGWKSVTTEDLSCKFMTYEFMMELKEYFEQRGFNVKEESFKTGRITSWLRISWE